jgi:NAD(P)-dependent dehydrogenase (short-subunit alcohol dehydrogenase family)
MPLASDDDDDGIVVEGLSTQARGPQAALTGRAEVAKLFDAAEGKCGQVEVLINNAATHSPGKTS